MRGVGLEPPLKLSHSVLRCVPIAPGDRETRSIFVSNSTKTEQPFEFFVPRPLASHLRISPLVGVLAPGGTARVEIEFSPPKELAPDYRPPAAATLASASISTGADSGEPATPRPRPPTAATRARTRRRRGRRCRRRRRGRGRVDARRLPRGRGGVPEHEGFVKYAGTLDGFDLDDPWRRARRSTRSARRPRAATTRPPKRARRRRGRRRLPGEAEVVPAPAPPQNKPLPPLPDVRGKLEAEPWSRHATWRVPCYVAQGSGQQAHATPLFVQVHTTVVQRTVSADVDQLDFGQLAVGQTRVLPLRLRNRGPTAIGPPTAEGLNGTGPFAVVNALRGLPPATGLHVALVRFAPMAQGVRPSRSCCTAPRWARRCA